MSKKYRIVELNGSYALEIPVSIFGIVLFWRNWMFLHKDYRWGHTYMEYEQITRQTVQELEAFVNHFKGNLRYRRRKIVPVYYISGFFSDKTVFGYVIPYYFRHHPRLSCYDYMPFESTLEEARSFIDNKLKPEPKWKVVKQQENKH